MSSFSFSRENINVNPVVVANSGGTTTLGGTLFIKIFNQNLAGNNRGSNSVSVTYTAGQMLSITVPSALRGTGEFVERFVIAGSSTGSSGSWIQLAVIEAMDANGSPLALPISINLATDYDLSLNKTAINPAALPATAKLGALTSISSLGGAIYRFETTWPVLPDGESVIAVTGGVWVKHYATFNPEPSNVYGFQGDRQNNQAVATPTKLIAYNGTGTYSRSFYYSIFNDAVSGASLLAGTNIALQVLADGVSVTANLNEKVEMTLVGYCGSDGVLDTTPAIGLPSLLYNYADRGQIYLPADLPANTQAIYRVRLIYSLADFAQIGATRSLSLNLSTYAESPIPAPWSTITGDYISPDNGQFRVFPGLGLAAQVDSGQAVINGYQTPRTSQQIVVGFTPNTQSQQAVINATGQVSAKPATYVLSSSEKLLALVGTVPGENISDELSVITLSSAGGISIDLEHPVSISGDGIVSASYPDTRIAGLSGFCKFNVDQVAVYLTNGASTYRTTLAALNSTTQTINISELGDSVGTPATTTHGLFQPVSAISTTTTGTIPTGTYSLRVGYIYDADSITSIEHNQLFSINGSLGGGSAILFGENPPLSTQGEDGSVYITYSGSFYKKSSGSWSNWLDLVTDVELSGAISNHTSEVDPHPGYLTPAEGDARYPLSTALNESIDDRVAALLVAGTNTTLTYNDASDSLTISVPNEGIDDRVAALLQAGSNITLTYNDTANTLTIASTASGSSASGLQYTYNDNDPPTLAGQIRTTQTGLSVATTIAINSTDAQGKSATDVLNRIKNDTIFELRKDGDNWVRYLATADFTSGSVAVTVQQFLGTIVTTDTVFLSVVSGSPSTGEGGGGSGSTLPITFGDGTATSFTITHNLGTRNVLFGIYKAASPYTEVSLPVERTTSNTLTINTAPYVPSAGEFIIVVSSVGSTSGSSGRIRLSGPQTYYVRADGTRTGDLTSETDATTNTSGDAFGNLQTAILAMASLDCSVYTPTIQLQDGTYPYFYLVNTLGSKSPVISGNSGDINAVILQGFESRFIGNPWLIKNCKISQTALYSSVSVESSRILFGAINWGDTQGILVDAQKASTVVFTEGFTMSGSGSDRGFVAGGCSQIYLLDGSTVSRLNTPTFPGGFLQVSENSFARAVNVTFSGARGGLGILAGPLGGQVQITGSTNV